jgi:hypothetical protein
VEHDGLVVRRLHRLQAELVRVLVLVRAGVLLALVEEVDQVGRATGDDVLREDALDAVLDVLGRDRGPVLELEAVLELVGVGLAAVGDLTRGRRKVRDQLQALF